MMFPASVVVVVVIIVGGRTPSLAPPLRPLLLLLQPLLLLLLCLPSPPLLLLGVERVVHSSHLDRDGDRICAGARASGLTRFSSWPETTAVIAGT